MKKITLIALLMSVCVLGVFAKKGKQPIAFDKIPEVVQTEYQQFFTADQVQFITVEKVFGHMAYAFLLTDGTKLVFDERAGLHKAENKNGVLETLVPVKIVEYVHATFPNAIITSYKFEQMKQEVEINNDMELIFDKRGHFVRID